MKKLFLIFLLFVFSINQGWILPLQSCYPVLPGADWRSSWQLIILVTLSILLFLIVQRLKSWSKKASLFLKWPGLFPKTPLPSLKKSGGIVSLFHTIGTRTAADARNALIFLPVPGSSCADALPVSPFAPNAAASAVLFTVRTFLPWSVHGS